MHSPISPIHKGRKLYIPPSHPSPLPSNPIRQSPYSTREWSGKGVLSRGMPPTSASIISGYRQAEHRKFMLDTPTSSDVNLKFLPQLIANVKGGRKSTNNWWNYDSQATAAPIDDLALINKLGGCGSFNVHEYVKGHNACRRAELTYRTNFARCLISSWAACTITSPSPTMHPPRQEMSSKNTTRQSHRISAPTSSVSWEKNTEECHEDIGCSPRDHKMPYVLPWVSSWPMESKAALTGD